MEARVINFGRAHKNEYLTDCPVPYLKWLISHEKRLLESNRWASRDAKIILEETGTCDYNRTESRNQMWEPGQRVEENQGPLKGEKATIEINPEFGSHIQEIEPGWTAVWIRYDRDGAHLGPEKGLAILDAQWQDIEQLRIIK